VPLVSLFLFSDQAALSGLDKKLKIPPSSRGQAVPVVYLPLMDRRAVLRIQMRIRPDPDLISSGSYLFLRKKTFSLGLFDLFFPLE
jgi:hypothetical protein